MIIISYIVVVVVVYAISGSRAAKGRMSGNSIRPGCCCVLLKGKKHQKITKKKKKNEQRNNPTTKSSSYNTVVLYLQLLMGAHDLVGGDGGWGGTQLYLIFVFACSIDR